MTSPISRFAAILMAAVLAVPSLIGRGNPGQGQEWERALGAFRTGQFPAAIQICEAILKAAPEDYEFGFLLARAYGASGQYEKALARAETLLGRNPRDTDVLLFAARVRIWQRNLAGAEEGFQSVLRISPKNVEGLLGLADVALARGEPGRALEFCQAALREAPPTADVSYRLGRAYRLRGEIRTAKFNFGEAVRLEPANEDYRRAYEQTDPGLQTKAELRYLLRSERFSGSVEGYAVHQLAYQFPAPGNLGPAVLKINRTSRFGQGDIQVGGEFYPRLWRRAYGSLDLSIAPDAVYFPRLSSRFEVFQGAFDAAEFSLGYWRIAFPGETVNVYLGSAAYYLGSYYAVLRLSYNPAGGSAKTSWMAQVRRYFSDIDYVYVGYGRGERPFEIGTIQDLLVHRSWALLAGAKWHFKRVWKLEFSVGRVADDSGLSRDTLTVSTGYRW
jgi:YaiO family outer membrane protein